MKLVVGLGNPGKVYEGTRHNVGFVVVDSLSQGKKWIEDKKRKHKFVEKGDLVLVKPLTFMNASGSSVKSILGKYKDIKTKDIFIIHDDLDLEIGKYKIQKGRGPRDHGGLNSIYKHLGTKDFWHIRVGVDGRGKKKTIKIANFSFDFKPKRIPGEKYVLGKFTEEEKGIIERVSKEVIEDIKNNYL